ncbi:MAG: ArsR family transcriptional regulator [Erysipelotrichales bacterium]|nr:MAG: ArsR family transcriptional regulator [Erysipelotrichales bacterium]
MEVPMSLFEQYVPHHPEDVKRAQETLHHRDRIDELRFLFKMLADPTRLRVLMTLQSGDLCVADLSAALNMTSSAISHQLADLKNARLVTREKRGKHVFYRFNDLHVETIFKQALQHVEERYATHRIDD